MQSGGIDPPLSEKHSLPSFHVSMTRPNTEGIQVAEITSFLERLWRICWGVGMNIGGK
jgi:hypothetical protein